MRYLLNNKVYDTEKAEKILTYIKTIEYTGIFGYHSYPKYRHTLYKTNKGNFFVHIGEYVKCFITDDNTIGQFTGLHDKNGKEIYEGDITHVASEDENAFILWNTETARYAIQFEGWWADFDNFYGRDLEVIGNIYENNELLGGE